jgi:hypothetical protein
VVLFSQMLDAWRGLVGTVRHLLLAVILERIVSVQSEDGG